MSNVVLRTLPHTTRSYLVSFLRSVSLTGKRVYLKSNKTVLPLLVSVSKRTTTREHVRCTVPVRTVIRRQIGYVCSCCHRRLYKQRWWHVVAAAWIPHRVPGRRVNASAQRSLSSLVAHRCLASAVQAPPRALRCGHAECRPQLPSVSAIDE